MGKVVVGALGVIRKNKKVLIALRNDPTNPTLHHRWEFPGGEMNFDENLEEALIREVKEEVGVEIKVAKAIPYPLCRFFPRKQGKIKIIFMPYECEIIKGKPKPSNIEIAEVKWAKLSDIKLDECTPFTKELLINVLQS